VSAIAIAREALRQHN